MNFKDENNSLQISISKFYQKKLFTDVTIVGDDLVYFDVHRVIVSAYSHVLEGLLSARNQESRILYLRGVSGSILQKVISFFYNQEISLEESYMDEFVSLMNEFQVKGFQKLKQPSNYDKIERLSNPSKNSDDQPAPKETPNDNKKSINDAEDTAFFNDSDAIETVFSNEIIDDDNNEENDFKTTDLVEEIDPEVKPTFECGICDFQFPFQYDLSKHYRLNHRDRGDELKCKACSTSFMHTDQLKRHFLSLHMTPRFRCLLCNFKSGTLKYASDHARVHRPRTLECDLCEKVYKRTIELNAHKERVHELKTFECPICNKKLSNKSYLKTHIEAKHEMIKYSCSFCPYKATDKYYLQMHESAQHLGGEKFECKFCDYKGKLKASLLSHQKTVHENVRFYCDECPLKFRSAGQMRTHKKKKHL